MKRIIFLIFASLYTILIVVASPYIFVPKLGKLNPGQTAGGWSHLWFWSTIFVATAPWIINWLIEKISAKPLQKMEGLK